MDKTELESIKESILKLSHSEQDHLAGFLLMQRLKRNQLIMPSIHQRIEDADPDNWETFEKTRESLSE